MKGSSLEVVQAAKSEAAQVFGELAGQVAVGIMRIGEAGYGLKVNLSEQPPQDVVLPKSIAGVPVKVEVVGKIRKQ